MDGMGEKQLPSPQFAPQNIFCLPTFRVSTCHGSNPEVFRRRCCCVVPKKFTVYTPENQRLDNWIPKMMSFWTNGEPPGKKMVHILLSIRLEILGRVRPEI